MHPANDVTPPLPLMDIYSISDRFRAVVAAQGFPATNEAVYACFAALRLHTAANSDHLEPLAVAYLRLSIHANHVLHDREGWPLPHPDVLEQPKRSSLDALIDMSAQWLNFFVVEAGLRGLTTAQCQALIIWTIQATYARNDLPAVRGRLV